MTGADRIHRQPWRRRVWAFCAAAAAVLWAGWPGAPSDSAVPVNRMHAVGTLAVLAVLPPTIHRWSGPVRRGWGPRTARVVGLCLVLTLVVARAQVARFGGALGRYFPVIPGLWAIQFLLLVVIGGYLAAVLLLTSESVRLTRFCFPVAVGAGAVTAGALYSSARFGIDSGSPAMVWWWLAALVLPVVAGSVVTRLATRDPRRPADPFGQGLVAAGCATGVAALLVAVLTSATIALWPHRVPLQQPPPTAGGCPTCDDGTVVIPGNLRHEYLVELSVGEAGTTADAGLLVVPLIGLLAGACLGELSSRRRDPGGSSPGPAPAG